MTTARYGVVLLLFFVGSAAKSDSDKAMNLVTDQKASQDHLSDLELPWEEVETNWDRELREAREEYEHELGSTLDEPAKFWIEEPKLRRKHRKRVREIEEAYWRIFHGDQGSHQDEFRWNERRGEKGKGRNGREHGKEREESQRELRLARAEYQRERDHAWAEYDRELDRARREARRDRKPEKFAAKERELHDKYRQKMSKHEHKYRDKLRKLREKSHFQIAVGS